MTLRVAVLGGGPAGVGLARQILAGDAAGDAASDVEVEVFEANERVGGLAASFSVSGVVFDHGSHRLHPSVSPEILEVLERLLPGLLHRRPRHGRIVLGGRFIRFPLRPLDAVVGLPWRMTCGLLRDMVFRPDQDGVESFAGVLSRQLGPTLCREFYFPMARKLWGCEPFEIDAEQARRRVSVRSPWQILGRMFRQLWIGGRRGRGASFYYPDGGFGRIAERLAEDFEERGGRLSTSTRVTALRQLDRAWRVETEAGHRDFDRVFSTIPVSRLIGLLDPAAPSEITEAAGGLRSRAAVLVCVVLGCCQWTEFDAHYVPDTDVGLSRTSEPTHYSAARSDRDRTGVCIEVPCDVGDASWRMSDEDLVERVGRELVSIGLPPLEPLIAAEVRRVPGVYPIYDHGYDARLSAVLAEIDRRPGLVTLGRQGLFAHDNTHHALAMSFAAASCLGRDESWDEAGWDRARAGFAEHVVED
jgi:protoporphyrinogen oxidase